MERNAGKVINMGLMERTEYAIRAKEEIILAFRLPLVLDLGLYPGYYFRGTLGAWMCIYGNRDPREIFNQCQSKGAFGRLQEVGIFRPGQDCPGSFRPFYSGDKN